MAADRQMVAQSLVALGRRDLASAIELLPEEAFEAAPASSESLSRIYNRRLRLPSLTEAVKDQITALLESLTREGQVNVAVYHLAIGDRVSFVFAQERTSEVIGVIDHVH